MYFDKLKSQMILSSATLILTNLYSAYEPCKFMKVQRNFLGMLIMLITNTRHIHNILLVTNWHSHSRILSCRVSTVCHLVLGHVIKHKCIRYMHHVSKHKTTRQDLNIRLR